MDEDEAHRQVLQALQGLHEMQTATVALLAATMGAQLRPLPPAVRAARLGEWLQEGHRLTAALAARAETPMQIHGARVDDLLLNLVALLREILIDDEGPLPP
jgi:hypothetical protein